jgi:hypothetical protein
LIGGPEEGWGSPRIVGALLGAVVSVALFVVVEQLQRRPMFDLNLFRKPTFVAAMVLLLRLPSVLWHCWYTFRFTFKASMATHRYRQGWL